MHYYQFNIGDYIKSTYHLDDTEDLIYRRLLDLCYDSEKPLPKCPEQVARLIRMRGEAEKTQAVLSEFFKLTKHGWIQKRIQQELSKYSAKAQTARVNGKLGGRPVGPQKKPSGLSEITQSKAKQEPITNNQEPIKRVGRFKPPTHSEVNELMADSNEVDKFIDFYESKNWMVGKNKMKDWRAAARNWIRRKSENNQRAIARETKSEKSARLAREALTHGDGF